MKKAILIVVTVAILGVLGLYATKKNTASPTVEGTNSSASNNPTKSYKDGTYTGDTADTPYGPVQIAITISGGKITDVNFLQMPNAEQRSVEITGFAEPELKQNTISAQGPDIDFVTGATSSSYGYKESLQAALDNAAGSAYILNHHRPVA